MKTPPRVGSKKFRSQKCKVMFFSRLMNGLEQVRKGSWLGVLGVWSQLLIALYLNWYYHSFYCVYCFFLLFYTNDNPLKEFISTLCYSCLTSPLSTHLLIYFWHSFLSVCKAVPHSFCGCIMPEWIIIYLTSPQVLLVQVIIQWIILNIRHFACVWIFF